MSEAVNAVIKRKTGINLNKIGEVRILSDFIPRVGDKAAFRLHPEGSKEVEVVEGKVIEIAWNYRDSWRALTELDKVNIVIEEADR